MDIKDKLATIFAVLVLAAVAGGAGWVMIAAGAEDALLFDRQGSTISVSAPKP